MRIRDTETQVKLAPTDSGYIEQIINQSSFQFGVFSQPREDVLESLLLPMDLR